MAKRRPSPASGGSAPARPASRWPRSDIKHTSVYLPEAAYEALRQVAFEERRKIHDLLLEGVELALKKRGYPALGKVAAQGTLSLSPLSPELGALETQLAKNLLSIGLGHTPGAAAG